MIGEILETLKWIVRIVVDKNGNPIEIEDRQTETKVFTFETLPN